MSAGTFEAVLAELADEHARSLSAHGFDAAHDDRHTAVDWGWRILRRVSEVMAPPTVLIPDPAEQRRALLEIANIAAAAVASLDRRDKEHADGVH